MCTTTNILVNTTLCKEKLFTMIIIIDIGHGKFQLIKSKYLFIIFLLLYHLFLPYIIIEGRYCTCSKPCLYRKIINETFLEWSPLPLIKILKAFA